MDLFDDPATCAKLLTKLVRSYALGAIGNRPKRISSRGRCGMGRLLRMLGLADAKRFPAVGLGEDWWVQGEHIQAAALAHNGVAVHLCAFAS